MDKYEKQMWLPTKLHPLLLQLLLYFTQKFQRRNLTHVITISGDRMPKYKLLKHRCLKYTIWIEHYLLK